MTPNEAILELAKQQKAIAETLLKQSESISNIADNFVKMVGLFESLTQKISFWRSYSGIVTGTTIALLVKIIWP